MTVSQEEKEEEAVYGSERLGGKFGLCPSGDGAPPGLFEIERLRRCPKVASQLKGRRRRRRRSNSAKYLVRSMLVTKVRTAAVLMCLKDPKVPCDMQKGSGGNGEPLSLRAVDPGGQMSPSPGRIGSDAFR